MNRRGFLGSLVGSFGLAVVGKQDKVTAFLHPPAGVGWPVGWSDDRCMIAITPNELRALRGRKPFAEGGDDPLIACVTMK